MSETEVIGKFRKNYLRDGFAALVFSCFMVFCSILVLIFLLLWFIFSKPQPVYFSTGDNWRVVPPVPVSRPYIQEPNLIQWVSDVIPRLFSLDFVNYSTQLNELKNYFTPEGWVKLRQVIKKIAAREVVLKNKWFVSASAYGAPYIINQGLIDRQYGWWIQMPINLSYSSSERGSGRLFVVQVLVVRVSTVDDLSGIRIKNIIVKSSAGN